MARLFSFIVICAAVAFAAPAAAQQDTSGGVSRQERATQDASSGTAQDTAGRSTTQVPGASQMGADSAMAGRPGQGLTPRGGQDARAGADTGADDRAGANDNYGKTGNDQGGTMPTTASNLPLLVLAGAVLVGVGVVARRFAKS